MSLATRLIEIYRSGYRNKGGGGEFFDQKVGFPGSFVAGNLTPYALQDWSDGEILRAITSGVNKDGQAMFPIMPDPLYGKASSEDIFAIIAYLRSLNRVEKEWPESKADFPLSLLISLMPQEPDFTETPDKSDTIAYGKHLYNLAVWMLVIRQGSKALRSSE